MRAFSLPLEFQVLALCPVLFGEQVRVPSFHIWNLIHSFIRSVGIYRTPTISQTFFLDSGTSVYILTHIKCTFECGEKVSKCYVEKCHGRHRGGEEGEKGLELEQGCKQVLWGRQGGGGI